jgi:hypothetical protein
MKIEFKAEDSQGAVHPVRVESAPDVCPLCHVGIDPKFHFAFFLDNDYPTVNDNHVQAVLQCPRADCRRIFIAYYIQRNRIAMQDRERPKYQLTGIAPYSYKEEVFPESIRKVSPSFCTIFNEAAHAEGRNLKNIAGPGYRKALEFLLKDFLVAEYPNEAEQIKKEWLGNLIRDKVQDENIKGCAERAAWLGNDESHYLRKWDDKDLSDLRTLIRLCVNWIENHLLTKRYLRSMRPNKHP